MKFLRQTVLLFLFAFTAQAQTLNWVFVSATGVPKPSTDTSAKPLYLYLATAGDIYLDDVSVVAGSTTNGVNLVTNGGFEGALSPWTIGSDGNNSNSVVSANFAHSGTNSLHLVAAAGGTTKNSSIWQDFSSSITIGGTYTLSFWYRQSTNGGPLIVRFSGGGIGTTNNPAPPSAPDTNPPVVVSITPASGATVSNLTQIQVTFSENVSGVDAEDLLIAGNPADSISGSGSNYVFNFTQPPPGTVLVYWDVDSGITDLSGNAFDNSGNWTYTLIDSIPPTIVSTTPAAGATVGSLTQAQVIFSEAVTGVNASAFLVNGVPAASVSGSGIGPYVFQFAQPAQGPVQFSWSPGQNIRDAASNLFGGAGWTATLNSATTAAALTNIVINEFLAGNTSTNGLLDEDGLLDSWIEIYNRGGATVNLAGWSLTDDAGQPAMWTFPATNIAAGQYLVIFASGDDRRVPGANLHTNFKLGLSTNYLGLYNADFPPRVAHEYAPAYPEQRNNISYGLDNNGVPGYFAIPTPGGPNGFSTITGVVAQLNVSLASGFFSQPTNVALTTATPGATILYTTNGSVPSISGSVTNGNALQRASQHRPHHGISRGGFCAESFADAHRVADLSFCRRHRPAAE